MSLLILLRHGESEWNLRNLFTGWVDVPLSPKGIDEALRAGEQIKDIPIDVIYTTPLMRAKMTAMLAMSRHSSDHVPIIMHEGEGKMVEWAKINSEKTRNNSIPTYCVWQLNERMYGDLQGLNKAETADHFGAEQVKLWRRSFATPPPNGESLKMTVARSIPFFEGHIVPKLKAGKNVLVSAHGNSLRSIIMDLEDLTEDEVVSLELATGIPIFYEYKDETFKRLEHIPR